MIRDWPVSFPRHRLPTGPIGDPFTTYRPYLQAFYVLEAMAFSRMTHRELLPWGDCLNQCTSREIALEELARRESEES